MEIQSVGKASFAIILDEGELQKRNLIPEKMTENDAKTIVQEVFGPAKCRGWNKACVDLFAAKNEVFMFVKLSVCVPEFVAFEDLEQVISAAGECSDFPPSVLACIDGTYILAVYPLEYDTAVNTLLEFGEKLNVKKEYELHLYEHGEIIIGADAISLINGYFSAKTDKI